MEGWAGHSLSEQGCPPACGFCYPDPQGHLIKEEESPKLVPYQGVSEHTKL